MHSLLIRNVKSAHSSSNTARQFSALTMQHLMLIKRVLYYYVTSIQRDLYVIHQVNSAQPYVTCHVNATHTQHVTHFKYATLVQRTINTSRQISAFPQ